MMQVYTVKYEPISDRIREYEKQKELADKLLAFVLKKHYGLELQKMMIQKGPQGKPYFADCCIKFNKSHSDGMVAVAVGESELGIDCQLIKPVSEALVRRTCSEKEQAAVFAAKDPDAAFALIWAKKESLVKMTGTGLTVSIREINSESVKNCLLTKSHAVAAVCESGEDAEFFNLTERDIS